MPPRTTRSKNEDTHPGLPDKTKTRRKPGEVAREKAAKKAVKDELAEANIRKKAHIAELEAALYAAQQEASSEVPETQGQRPKRLQPKKKPVKKAIVQTDVVETVEPEKLVSAVASIVFAHPHLFLSFSPPMSSQSPMLSQSLTARSRSNRR